jgi:hypothetical protein
MFRKLLMSSVVVAGVAAMALPASAGSTHGKQARFQSKKISGIVHVVPTPTGFSVDAQAKKVAKAGDYTVEVTAEVRKNGKLIGAATNVGCTLHVASDGGSASCSGDLGELLGVGNWGSRMNMTVRDANYQVVMSRYLQ